MPQATAHVDKPRHTSSVHNSNPDRRTRATKAVARGDVRSEQLLPGSGSDKEVLSDASIASGFVAILEPALKATHARSGQDGGATVVSSQCSSTKLSRNRVSSRQHA